MCLCGGGGRRYEAEVIDTMVCDGNDMEHLQPPNVSVDAAESN